MHIVEAGLLKKLLLLMDDKDLERSQQLARAWDRTDVGSVTSCPLGQAIPIVIGNRIPPSRIPPIKTDSMVLVFFEQVRGSFILVMDL